MSQLLLSAAALEGSDCTNVTSAECLRNMARMDGSFGGRRLQLAVTSTAYYCEHRQVLLQCLKHPALLTCPRKRLMMVGSLQAKDSAGC